MFYSSLIQEMAWRKIGHFLNQCIRFCVCPGVVVVVGVAAGVFQVVLFDKGIYYFTSLITQLS